MCSWLQPYFSCCCEITAAFVIQQLQSASCVTYPHIMSALQLIEKVHNSCFCKYLTVHVVQEFHWNFFCRLKMFFFFLHFSLACLTELCSVRFWAISSFRTSRVSKLSLIVKIDYVTSDTRDVDPSWYGQFMCEWVKRQQGNKRIGVESRVTNLFIILFYYSVFC